MGNFGADLDVILLTGKKGKFKTFEDNSDQT